MRYNILAASYYITELSTRCLSLSFHLHEPLDPVLSSMEDVVNQ